MSRNGISVSKKERNVTGIRVTVRRISSMNRVKVGGYTVFILLFQLCSVSSNFSEI